MKNNILYILDNALGITKVGISEDFDSRIDNINKNLTEEKKFRVVSIINVINHPAIVETFIHEFLSMKQKNLIYLKENKILEYDGFAESKNSGYTEYFLSDKESLKECISLFGILGLLEVSENELSQIDNMEDFPFDILAEKFPQLLKNTFNSNISIFKNQPFVENKNISIEYIEKKIKNNEKITVDFGIKNGSFILKVDDFTIQTNEFFSEKNKSIIEYLHTNSELLYSNIKNWRDLYPILKILMKENKYIGFSPVKGHASLNKEIKKNKFNDFIKNDGLKDLKEYFSNSSWEFCDSAADEFLFNKKNFKKEEVLGWDVSQSKKEKYIKAIKNYTEINFNSPKNMLGNYFTGLDVLYDTVSNEVYCNYFYTGSIIESIFKHLYESEDKNNALSDCLKILKFTDASYGNWNISNCEKLIKMTEGNNEFKNIAKGILQLYYDEDINKVEDVKKLRFRKK